MKQMKLLKYLLATCAVVVLTGGGAKAAESQASPSSDPNYRIELVDPPADGYEPYADVPMKVYLNNNTGHDLSDVKVNFTLKKKAKNADEPMEINGISKYIQFKDVPNGYNQNTTFTGEYATYQITRNKLSSISETFSMRLTYPIRNRIQIDDISKLDPDWMSYGNSEFEVTFTSGNTVLARQNIILQAKPQHPTYRLTLHSDKSYGANDTIVSERNPVSITNAKTRLLWITLSPTSGLSVIDGTKHVTFHLPDGTEFDHERFKKHYPWLDAQVNGHDVSVNVPPYVTGVVWTGDATNHTREQRVSTYYITPYINIPITIVGDVHTPYTFSVDGDISASMTITDKEIKQVDPKTLVKPNVGSYMTENGWITPVYVSINANKQFVINSETIDVKQSGMVLKQLSIYSSAKIYGIKDGKKIELTRSKLTHNPTYYEMQSRNNDFVSGLEVYDTIEIVYTEPKNDSYVGYNFETIDKAKLLNTFPITYNIDNGENVETSTWFSRIPITHNASISNGDRKFVNTINGRLYYTSIYSYLHLTPLYGHYETYLLYKYEKDMRVTHSYYEELVKREIVGDTVYDLTKVIIKPYGSIEYQIAEFLPSMTDGTHKLTAKAFFNPDMDIPTNYISEGIRQPFDFNRSLKDNYDNSTNKENVIDFTYESPKRLQVSALLDGSTRKDVTDITQTMDFVHYIANKSTQDYEDVSGEVTLPNNMYLSGTPTTDDRYKFLYEENGNFVENPTDIASVRKLKIVPKDNTTLRINEIIETHMSVKLKDTTIYNSVSTIQSKMVYKGSDTKAQDVSVYVKDHSLADGKVNVNYVLDGKTIKTATITKKHGSAYTVDTTDFVKDGKHYEFDHVDGDATGTIVGLEIKDVIVHVKERAFAFVFDLPTTGTANTMVVLLGLVVLFGLAVKYRKTSI